MEQKERFIFEPFEEITDFRMTKCAVDKDPEIVVAVIGEDMPDEYPTPLYLGNKYVVVLPQIIVGYSKEITIWFSKDVHPDTMANLIQEYFMVNFPKLKIDDNTVMGVSEPGKITIRQGEN